MQRRPRPAPRPRAAQPRRTTLPVSPAAATTPRPWTASSTRCRREGGSPRAWPSSRSASPRSRRSSTSCADRRLREAEPRRTPGSAAGPASCCAWPRSRPTRCSCRPQAQADEIRASGRNADADALSTQASRDAEDMRMVQLKELDEQRAGAMGEVERDPLDGAKAEADDLLRLRPARGRPAPAGRRAGGQRRCAPAPGARPSRPGAAADREVQEARRALAVEKERLTREAAEHHTNAVAETQRWSSRPRSAPTPPSSGPARPSTSRRRQRQQAAEEAERLLTRARREAEQIVVLRADAGRALHRRRPGGGRAPARRAARRGRPAHQAPRLDRRPARRPARRRGRLRRRRRPAGRPRPRPPHARRGRRQGSRPQPTKCRRRPVTGRGEPSETGAAAGLRRARRPAATRSPYGFRLRCFGRRRRRCRALARRAAALGRLDPRARGGGAVPRRGPEPGRGVLRCGAA